MASTLYHVAFARNLDNIRSRGLTPGGGQTFAHGFYKSYSKGKLFLTSWRGVSFWVERLGDMADNQSDAPIDDGMIPIVLKADVSGVALEEDPEGTRDARAPSFFATEAIPKSKLRVWDGSGWKPLSSVTLDDVQDRALDAAEIEHVDGEELVYPDHDALLPTHEERVMSRERFQAALALFEGASGKAIEVEKKGRRYYMRNTPFAAKDKLKRAGFKWDNVERAWWTGKKALADDMLGKIQGETGGSERISPTDRVIKGRAKYKGKTYYVLYHGPTARGQGTKLAFRDGTKTFWAKGPVEIVKMYRDPRSIKELKDYAAQRKAAPKGAPTQRQLDYAKLLLRRTSPRDWHDTDLGQGMPKPSPDDLDSWSAEEVSYLIQDLKDR